MKKFKVTLEVELDVRDYWPKEDREEAVQRMIYRVLYTDARIKLADNVKAREKA